MITCKLIIKEMPGGRVAVAVDPDQTNATKNELRAASVIDAALQAVGELLIKDKDIMVAGEGVTDYVKSFISRCED